MQLQKRERCEKLRCENLTEEEEEEEEEEDGQLNWA